MAGRSDATGGGAADCGDPHPRDGHGPAHQDPQGGRRELGHLHPGGHHR